MWGPDLKILKLNDYNISLLFYEYYLNVLINYLLLNTFIKFVYPKYDECLILI